MKRPFPIVLLMAFLLAVGAFAELSDSFKEWLDTPAGLLATKAEQKAFKKLDSDAQAQEFIDLFWARRDPDLETAVNEFKADFEMRVDAADKLFTWEKRRGALTDRGRTLIVMGKPDHLSNIPAGSTQQGIRSTSEPGQAGGSNYEDLGATEIWEYRKDKLPAGVKANQVYFVFRESRVGLNDFVLDRTDRRNTMAMKSLGEAPEGFLLHPKLTEVPKIGLVPGSKPCTSAQLARLDVEPQPWPDGASVVVRQGLQSAAMQPLWVQVHLPDAVPAATEVIGRVRTSGGDDFGTFAKEIAPLSAPGERIYEMTLPVEQGSWSIDLAYFNAGEPVAVTHVDAETVAAPAGEPFLSPFYWGVDVRQEAQTKMGDPFNIGGWHVIMRPDNTYTNKETLSFFTFVLGPSLGDDGTPSYQYTMALFAGDKKLTETPPQPANLSQITPEIWMYGSGLPLAAFRKAGEYALRVTLTDTLADVSTQAEIPLVVTVE